MKQWLIGLSVLCLLLGAPAQATRTDFVGSTGELTSVSPTSPLPITQADGGNATLGAKADSAAASDSGTYSLIALIKRLLGDWTAGLAASENHIGAVGGNQSCVSVTLTRPSDTTAYTALDVMTDSTSAPTALTFTNLARISGGSGYITKARLMTNQSTNTARFRLQLWDTAPTAINDNSPFTLLWANRATRLGSIDFPAMATEGTGSDAATALVNDLRLQYLTNASRNIYGELEAIDGFTPASGQLTYVQLCADNY